MGGKADDRVGRRDFLSRAAMAGGLAAGYGAFGAIATRYLYPATHGEVSRLFVSDVASLRVGDALAFTTPSGATASIARIASTGDASDFIALSSTCPHLGCKVHWEATASRFFCPCHNGAFDATGKAIAGPPADAGQSLLRYPLVVENGLLFIEVPVAA